MLKRKLSALTFIITSFLTFSPLFADTFKYYAVGFDSGYTVHALIYGGFGAGIEAEMLASGIFSLAADLGYENFNVTDGGVKINNQLIYLSAGGRVYMTFDAIKGPFLGILLGIRLDTLDGITYSHLIAPLEFGWKFVFDNTGFLYAEPLVKVVIMPYYDSVNVSIQNSYAFFLGVNIGAAF